MKWNSRDYLQAKIKICTSFYKITILWIKSWTHSKYLKSFCLQISESPLLSEALSRFLNITLPPSSSRYDIGTNISEHVSGEVRHLPSCKVSDNAVHESYSGLQEVNATVKDVILFCRQSTNEAYVFLGRWPFVHVSRFYLMPTVLSWYLDLKLHI